MKDNQRYKDKPLTDVERSAAYRERLKTTGKKRVHFTVDAEMVTYIDELVDFYHLKGRYQVISDLLTPQLNYAIRIMNEWKENPNCTFNDAELTEADEETLKLAKSTLWDALTMEVGLFTSEAAPLPDVLKQYPVTV